MAENHREDVERLDLQTIVGSRLREQRLLRDASLRDTANAAGISPGHLSDIENGKSHVSLPVLLRLCRALHLPVADLLPRLGGRRIRETVAIADRPGSQRLSHRQLELRVDRLVIAAGGEHCDKVAAGDDVFVYVVAGSCQVAVAGVTYELEQGDAMDVERADQIEISSAAGVTTLLIRAARR